MKQNSKCGLFCTKGGTDPESLVDGLLLSWMHKFVYLFPLLLLIPGTISKIQREHPRVILITPWWPRQPWFVTLPHLSKGTWHQFLLREDLLTRDKGQILHHNIGHLVLVAWMVKDQ